MEEKTDFLCALVLAVAKKYDMTARDAVGMVMTSRFATHDFVPTKNYSKKEIEEFAASI